MVRYAARSDLNVGKLVGEFVQKPVLVSLNESTKNTARLMAANNSCSAVVCLNQDPIGIVTEWDILTRLVVLGKDASKTPVKEVMSAPIWTVSPSTKVDEAITLMVKRGFRRLIVKDGTNVKGIISVNVIIGNRREDSIPISLLEVPNSHTCPFCGEAAQSREAIWHHVDNELALKL